MAVSKHSRSYKPKSTTKKAKSIIRSEMLSYFPANEYGTKTRLQAMKKDADAGNGGRYGKGYVTDYQKGAYLVDAGCCAVYYDQQSKMLSKIYGKRNVDKWSGQKKHNTYKHLIGREYEAMQKEQRKKRYSTKRKTKKR